MCRPGRRRSTASSRSLTFGESCERSIAGVGTHTIAGDLELYVRIPSLASLTDTEVYLYCGNAGAAWNADYGIVYHLKEDPTGTAPQARDSTVNAVHGTYDLAGATVEDNTLWGGKCILFDNGPRLRVDDNAAIENADRITIEAWVNTLSWPGRAVVCRKEGSYILYNFSGGFSWYLFGPDNRLQYDIAGTLGNGSWGYIVGTYDKDAGANNQRLYLNGIRVAQMSDTLPIDLYAAALGIGRHVSGIADPFRRPYQRVPQRAHPALRRLDPDHLEQRERPRCFAVAGAEKRGMQTTLAGDGPAVLMSGAGITSINGASGSRGG
jgi:hypothetical protein